MKQIVMKVKHFFNVDRRGEVLTLFGGSLNVDIVLGEMVEIHTVNDVLKTNIVEIKCYNKNLDKALAGLSCGLVFSGLHHMQFRVSEPIFNPYSPKTDLGKYLAHDSKTKEAEGVWVIREVPDEPPAKERDQRDSAGDYPKPNFLFLHGS